MEFKFKDSEMIETGRNSFIIISKEPQINPENIIQIIDENGYETNCTLDKFLEIFDNQGLAGFIS